MKFLKTLAPFCLGALGLAGPVHAQLQWPDGAAPCDDLTDLQACVDVAPAGSVLEITADVIPDFQTVHIEHSLELRPAAGVTPRFSAGALVTVTNTPAGVAAVVEGLEFSDFQLRVFQNNSPAMLDFVLRDNIIHDVFQQGLLIYGAGQSNDGPMQVLVENNHVDVPAGGQALYVLVPWSSGNQVRIRNNTFRINDESQGAAIEVSGPLGRLTSVGLEISGNRIEGADYNAGIALNLRSLSEVDATVINNVVIGQNGNVGLPGGIATYIEDTTVQGRLLLVNNTVAHGRMGFSFRADTGLGDNMLVAWANNISAFNSQYDIQAHALGDRLVNDYNLVFGSPGPNGFTPGPNAINADPRFVGALDLRLLPGSPAIDAGIDTVLPLDVTTDVEGLPRFQGAAVDIGAHEAVPSAAPPPAPAAGAQAVAVPTLDRPGLYLLVLLVLGVAWIKRP